jgi:NADH-quinone oxidoreductase subunit M
MLFGPLNRPENQALTDIGAREVAMMVPMVALVVWIGVRPNTFLEPTRQSLQLVELRVERARALEAARLAPAVERPESQR